MKRLTAVVSDHFNHVTRNRFARTVLVAMAIGLSCPVIGDSGLPFSAEENADGAKFVWYVLNRSDMKFDYLPADHFAESPNFRQVEHGLQQSGDVAWWPQMMAIYDSTFARARELPSDVSIVTAKGPLSLTTLEQEMGPAVFYRYKAADK
jgi:hypothetical protein